MIMLMGVTTYTQAQKPVVWLISDGGEEVNDPDDISAIAGYLLMSNHFDTRAIVMASTTHPWNAGGINQAEWAEENFGKAYKAGLANLNKYIGGYQSDMRFIESSIKGCGKSFQWQEKYDLNNYQSIKALFNEVKSSKELINVLCFGPLTEQAIFVSYCISSGNENLLNKVRFISHWTSSNYHVGTIENPDKTHNCIADPISCNYMKEMARNGRIKFYECGGIGQYGIVEGSPQGASFYKRFEMSELGKLFVEGKFIKERVDDSDCATYFALLGNYGVSLNDIASNGLNLPEVEMRNERAFSSSANAIRKEMMRRSDAAAGLNPSAIKVDVIVKEHGMADAHAWVKNDTLFIGCGHDSSPDPHASFSMDRWEIWSTNDLRNWKYHCNIEPADNYMGAGDDCFAGDITSRNGKYYWFFSNRTTDTGVMVADKIDGEYKDLLGKPIVSKDMIPVHAYDPEVYDEDGVYTLCLGNGTYYMATLAEDMKSLTTELKPIEVLDDEGNYVRTSDKSSLYKHNGWYYLIYGHQYAMSRDLYGPYLYKGDFLNGGHTSLFEWHGQTYVLQENHDTSAFYRGISLKPVFFNEDGTVIIPPDDRMFPGPGRSWDFESSTMAWKAQSGTSLYRTNDENGSLGGVINAPQAIVTSAAWLYTLSEECDKIRIRIKNNTYATNMRLAIFSRNKGAGFWKASSAKRDWTKEQWVNVPIEANCDEFREYTIPLSKFGELNERIMQIGVQPAANTYNGEWAIDKIVIE